MRPCTNIPPRYRFLMDSPFLENTSASLLKFLLPCSLHPAPLFRLHHLPFFPHVASLRKENLCRLRIWVFEAVEITCLIMLTTSPQQHALLQSCSILSGMEAHTSRNLPHPPPPNTKLIIAHIYRYPSRENPEYHMILPCVLHSLFSIRRNNNHSRMEEW